jgi:hypothetical protein
MQLIDIQQTCHKQCAAAKTNILQAVTPHSSFDTAVVTRRPCSSKFVSMQHITPLSSRSCGAGMPHTHARQAIRLFAHHQDQQLIKPIGPQAARGFCLGGSIGDMGILTAAHTVRSSNSQPFRAHSVTVHSSSTAFQHTLCQATFFQHISCQQHTLCSRPLALPTHTFSAQAAEHRELCKAASRQRMSGAHAVQSSFQQCMIGAHAVRSSFSQLPAHVYVMQ